MPRHRRPRSVAGNRPSIDSYAAPYFDAAVFIAWIMGEIADDGSDCADIVENLLRQAERGAFKVYISSLTLAEVYKPKGYDSLKPTQNHELLEYFEHEFFEMVMVDRDIGIEANRIAAMYGLNPNDAIHTACALRAGCEVVLTWDRRFLGKTVPGIRIERPEKRGQAMMDLDSEN